MRKVQLKKVLLALAFGILTVFLTAASAFAASYEAELKQLSQTPEVPAVSSNESYAESASYVGYTSSASQIAAETDSITIKWEAVSNATYYNISIGNYGSNDFKKIGSVKSTAVKINKLKPGKVYSIRITAANSSESSAYYRQLNCATLHTSASVKSTTAGLKKYTFNMNVPSVAGSITGYRVTYYNYKKGTSATKDFNSNYSFTLSINQDAFYKVVIRPYLTLNGKKFVSPSGTTKYIALQPGLKKGGHTTNSMTVRWNKVYGATSYSIYVKYPGSSKFKKVKTTSATSYKLNGMKLNNIYYMKVIANKKVGKTTWKTKDTQYYSLRLYRS